MKVRAERAGVLDRLRVTPPGLRERAKGLVPGCSVATYIPQEEQTAAATELQKLQKYNHQVVDDSRSRRSCCKRKHFAEDVAP